MTAHRLRIGLLALALWVVLPVFAHGQSLEDAGAYLAEGRLAEAVEVFQAVAAATQDLETAARARNNACVLLNNLGEYPAALDECDAALELRRRLPNERALGRTLNNTGLTRQNLGLLQPARESFLEALEINRRLEDLEGQVVNLNNLGISDTLAGRYATALANHAEAARLARGASDAPWAAYQVHLARLNEGVVLERLGSYREALAAYRTLLDETGSPEALSGEGSDDPRDRALVLVNVGVVYRNLGDPVTAVDYFRRAAARFEESGDRAGLANAWLNQGIAQHFDLRELSAAEASYGRAMELAEAAGDLPQQIEGLYYNGRLLLDLGRLDAAEAAFERCRAEAEIANYIEGIWSGREGLARVARERGDLELALERFRSTIEAIERQRGEILGADLRAGYFGSRRGVYGAAVAVLAELDRRDPGADHRAEALELAQRVKNRELTEALGGDHLSPDRRPRVPAEGVLVEFLEAEGRLYRWWADSEGVELVDLGPAREISEMARTVDGELATGRPPRPEDLATLSGRLWGGIDDSPEELWIAPDGSLHRFPFELLVVNGRALVESSVLRYLPSGALLGRLTGAAGEPALGWLGAGGESLPRGPALDPWVERWALEPLPGAARELEYVARKMPEPQRFLREQEATEEGLRRALAGGTRVLHLASHAVVAPAGSVVLLHPSPEEDGLLEPREIAALQVPIDLTVLSACRTSLAQSPGVSSLSTLTGAFLVGGSRSVIATLWDVDDAATAVFMEQFYAQLRRGIGVAEALRHTKLRLRQDPRWSNPSLWAAYVLVGEGGAVVEAPRRWGVLVAGLFGILLALGAILFARRR